MYKDKNWFDTSRPTVNNIRIKNAKTLSNVHNSDIFGKAFFLSQSIENFVNTGLQKRQAIISILIVFSTLEVSAQFLFFVFSVPNVCFM